MTSTVDLENRPASKAATRPAAPVRCAASGNDDFVLGSSTPIDEGGVVVALPSSPLPGDDRWLAAHGIDPDVWKRRGVWRYSTEERERVKDAFPSLDRRKLGTVSRIVSQSDGLVMPKFPVPGSEPIPPQLRPDRPVITDHRPDWDYHGRRPEGGWTRENWPQLPLQAGPKLAGRALVPLRFVPKYEALGRFIPGIVTPEDQAASHIESEKLEQYDPETGEGSHRGRNLNYVHSHAPHAAKYVLLGENKRMDVGPEGLVALRRAERIMLDIEGTLKHMALVSAGEAVISDPSVTLANEDELRRLARWFDRVPWYVVPDGDWFTNPQVDRQAQLVLALLESEGVEAFVASCPVWEGLAKCGCEHLARVSADGTCARCGGYFKGVDDFRGAGGAVEDFHVRVRELPREHITDWTFRELWRLHPARRRRALRALEGLSRHAGESGKLPTALSTLARIMGLARARGGHELVEPTLRDLVGVLDVEGSLETGVVEWDGVRVRDWTESPIIVLRDDFRAVDLAPVKLGNGLRARKAA